MKIRITYTTQPGTFPMQKSGRNSNRQSPINYRNQKYDQTIATNTLNMSITQYIRLLYPLLDIVNTIEAINHGGMKP